MSEAQKTSWDPTLEPLMKFLVGRRGVESRDVPEVGRKKVKLIRGKDIKELLLKEHTNAALRRIAPAALDKYLGGQLPKNEADVDRLCQDLASKGFLIRMMDSPHKTSSTSNAPAEQSSEKKKRKRWPDRVVKVSDTYQKFDTATGSYYMVAYEGSKVMQRVVLVLAIVFSLACCMFQIWPLWAKLWSWYGLVALSSVMTVILIFRLVLYILLWFFGIDFWLFPNINDEYCGIVDSFKPLYSIEYRQDELFMMVSRVVMAVVLAGAVYQVGQNYTFQDASDMTRGMLLDIVAWGEDKLINPYSNVQKYKSIEHIRAETADAFKEVGPSEEGAVEEEEF